MKGVLTPPLPLFGQQGVFTSTLLASLVRLRSVRATPESLFFGVATAKSLGVDIFHVPVPRPVYTVKSTLFFQVRLCVVTEKRALVRG